MTTELGDLDNNRDWCFKKKKIVADTVRTDDEIYERQQRE